jgi:hypothetical protein
MSVMTNEYRDTLQRLEVLSISLLIQQRIKFLDIGLERERDTQRDTERQRERERERERETESKRAQISIKYISKASR